MKKFIAACFIFMGVAILITLGAWQLDRLNWKNNIIEALESEYAKNPENHPYDYERLNALKDPLDIRYGMTRGKFDYNKEILLGPKPHEGEIGYLVITPLNIRTGGVVLVNRGWIAIADKDNINQTHNSKIMNIIGVFRKPDWNDFTPENSPENDIWTKLDINNIAEAKGIENPAPVILYMERASENFAPIIPQVEKWKPRNKHLQYAIFWFTMAGALLGVFGIFIYSNRQKNKRIS